MLGLLALVLPRARGAVAAGRCCWSLLAGAALAAVHVGVEQGWWPSPLPECARPASAAAAIAERLAQHAGAPAKPCDEPTYLVPGLPRLDGAR